MHVHMYQPSRVNIHNILITPYSDTYANLFSNHGVILVVGVVSISQFS